MKSSIKRGLDAVACGLGATILAAPHLALAIGMLMAPVPQVGGGGGAGGGNYPVKSIGYIGCSNTKGAVTGYAEASTRGVLGPAYATDDGYNQAWEFDTGGPIPGTGGTLAINHYNFWSKFDAARRTNNPAGGQKLLAVWVNLCESMYADANGLTPSTNTTIDHIFALLKKHTTDCLVTPSNCGELVAPNIASNLVVFVSMINGYRTQDICYLMNTGGVSETNSVNGTVAAGGTSLVLSGGVGGITVGGAGGHITTLLDDSTEAYLTVTSVNSLTIGFSPAVPNGRTIPSGSPIHLGDGAGQSSTSGFMQHAIGAGYAGFASVNYGPNGRGQSDAFYPTLQSADTHYYPFFLDGMKSPSDLAADGCHPSNSGEPALGTFLANFFDAQTHL